jgi:site-specific recombinase XerD
MLETYFSAPKTLRRLRAGPSGPFIDAFAASLQADGYSPATTARYLRAAAHLGHFLEQRGRTLTNIDQSTVAVFFRHFADCRCPLSNGGKRNHHTYFGAKRYRDFLVQIAVCQRDVAREVCRPEPALIAGFRRWLQKHRGIAETTITQYSRGAVALMTALGGDPTQWRAEDVRAYFVERAGRGGLATAERLVTSLRAFLQYLSDHGECRADLDQAVPAFASWRLAELPRYLTTTQVDRLIAACDGASSSRRRDRAILLLLARLGLRAGDVAQMRMVDIEWQTGTLRVSGKGRCQVRLPLPQEVGDAILAYIECRPHLPGCDQIFVRNIAPFRPFVGGDGVSNVVRRAMQRASIVTPAKGAHALRHTAATQMLRQDVPLDRIALVLRHRGLDTTAYYAKADVNLLMQIAQPWPEMLP